MSDPPDIMIPMTAATLPTAIPAGTTLDAALTTILDAAAALPDVVARTAALAALTDAINGPEGIAQKTRAALTSTLTERVAAGTTQSALARELGLTRQRVTQILEANGRAPRPRPTRDRAALMARARAGRRKGQTIAALAAEAGVNPRTIARWLADGSALPAHRPRFADDYDDAIVVRPQDQQSADR